MVYFGPHNTPVRVRTDWDDAGDFSNAYADVSEAKHLRYGVRIERGRDHGRVIGGPRIPSASWSLTNNSRRYATEYSGSPLHGLLGPGHLADIGRQLGDPDATWDDPDIGWDDPEAYWGGAIDVTLFTGRTRKPKERYGIGQRIVTFDAYGLMNLLTQTKISIDYQASITTGAAMELVLDEVETVTGVTIDRVIDPDEIANGFELLHWFVDGRIAWEVVRQIWANAGPPSAFYEDAYGRAIFEGKNYRSNTARCTDVQQIFADTNVTGELYHTDIQYDASTDSVISSMAIEVENRIVGSTQNVFDYGAVLVLTGGQVREFFVKNTTGNPWTSLVTPTAVTDFVIGAGSLSSVTAVAVGPMTVLVTFTAGGGGATINPSGSNHGWVLRAAPISIASTETATGTVIVVSDNPKEADKSLTDSIWRGISKADADALIDGYLLAYEFPRGVVTITLEASSFLLLEEVMSREISDRIFVSDAWSGIALDVSIEQITHEIDNRAQHRCILVCERIVELDWARWDSGQWDVDRWGQ